jgi:hydroxymethylglutaryl-CoA lyase
MSRLETGRRNEIGKIGEMSDLVKIVECPRDAWQGLPRRSRPKRKPLSAQADDAGFTHIDAVSFVSPAAVPQMADSERVLAYLNPPEDVEIIGIVVNEKGAERAIAPARCRRWAFLIRSPPSFSPQSASDAGGIAGRVGGRRPLATRRGPGWWPISRWPSEILTAMHGASMVVDACDLLIESGVSRFRLPIRWGWRRRNKSRRQWQRCLRRMRIEIGVHLHARPRRSGYPRFARHTMRGAGGLTRPSAGWADARLRRMRWWGTLPTETLIAEVNGAAARDCRSWAA